MLRSLPPYDRRMHIRIPLVAVIVVAGLVVPSNASAACADAAILPETERFLERAEAATFCLLNEQRTAHGLSPVAYGPASLRTPAVAYSRYMVERKFFSHGGPDGSTPATRLVGYTNGRSPWAYGENLGWGSGNLASPREMIKAWMNSPGHRDNVLDPRWVEVGIGVSVGVPQAGLYDGATYTTEFGVRSGAKEPPVIPAPDPGTTDTGTTDPGTTGQGTIGPGVKRPEDARPDEKTKGKAKPKTATPSRATVAARRKRCQVQTRVARRTGRRAHRIRANRTCASYRRARAARLA